MAKRDRAALLNPGLRYLRRIDGLTRAMADLLGVEPAALVGETGLVAAAEAIRTRMPRVEPDGANVRLRVERVRNPVAKQAWRALERLRAHAWRSGFDAEGLDALVAGAALEGPREGRGLPPRLLALAVAAAGSRDGGSPGSHADANRMVLVAKASALTGTPLSSLRDVGDVDDAMGRAHAARPRAIGPLAKPRLRYALVGDEAARALAARAIATRVQTFEGRLPATVVDAHAVDVRRVGREGGVVLAGRRRWSADEREDAALARLASVASDVYGWRFAEGPPDAPWASSLTRSALLRFEFATPGIDGREGDVGIGFEGLYAMRDGSVRRAYARRDAEGVAAEGVAPLHRAGVVDPAELLARGVATDDGFTASKVRRARMVADPVTGDPGMAGLVDPALGDVREGPARMLDRHGEGVAALQLARFRKTLPPAIDALIPRLSEADRGGRWRLKPHLDVVDLIDVLARAPSPERLLRAVETAPALASVVAEGVFAIDRARRRGMGADYAVAVDLSDSLVWERGRLPRLTNRAGHVVVALAAGGSPYDAVARRVEAIVGGEVGRWEARQLAGYVGRVENTHRAAKALRSLKVGNPNAKALRRSEVAAIAENGFLGIGSDPSPTRTVALLDAFKSRGRTGDLVRKPSNRVVDALLGVGLAMGGLGIKPGDLGHAVARSVAPKGRNMAGLERLSEAWHVGVGTRVAERQTLLRRLLEGEGTALADRGGGADARYPAPSLEPRPAPGTTVRQLRGDEAMVAEGVEMGHCVGTYAPEAARGDLLVFAIETPSGRSTAGFRVRVEDGVVGLERTQHTGPGREDAPEENRKAMAAHLARLRGNEGWMAAFAADRVGATVAEDLSKGRERGLPPAAREGLAAFDFASLAVVLSKDDLALGREGYLAAVAASAERERARDVALLAKAAGRTIAEVAPIGAARGAERGPVQTVVAPPVAADAPRRREGRGM